MYRFCILALSGLAALTTQALAASFLYAALSAKGSIVSFLGGQLMAAAASGMFVAYAFQRLGSRQRWGAFAHASSVCFILPVAGQLLFVLMMLAGIVFPRYREWNKPVLVYAPHFSGVSSTSLDSLSAVARLRPRLTNPGIAGPDRMAAMVALRTLPPRDTHAMLGNLLSDPLEEIRLLAYGISNSAENAIAQRILAASDEIETATTSEQKARLSSELAQLHWELVYQNLVQGQLRAHTVARAERYAHAALSLNEKQGGMWCLLGRCALLANKPVQAEEFLRLAQNCRFPAQRLAPWRAEAAFMKGEYGRIGELLKPLHDGALPSALQPVAGYWT